LESDHGSLLIAVNIHQSDDWRRLRLGLQLAAEFGLPPAAVLARFCGKQLTQNACGLYATGIRIPNRISEAFGYFLVSETLNFVKNKYGSITGPATDREQLQGRRGLARRFK